MFSRLSFIFIFCFHFAFAFDLQHLRTQTIFDGAAEYQAYVIREPKQFPIVVNLISMKAGDYHVSLFTKSKPYPLTAIDILRNSFAFFATNGGYYREGFQPNGLWIERGVTKSRLVQNSLLSAVVMIDHKGLIHLGGVDLDIKNAWYAFQVGPMIFDAGTYRENLAHGKQARRTVYGQTKQGDIVVMNIAYATMQQTVEVVKALAELNDWDWQTVVNFDGGQAAAFIIDLPNLSVVIPEQSVVKFVMLFSLSE